MKTSHEISSSNPSSGGVNVFMEKSFATDPVGIRRVIAAGKAAEKKDVKIAAGLMCRHSRNRQELMRRIDADEIGEVLHTRAYRMQGVSPLGPKPADKSELEWQLRNFTKFFWVSGGLWAEMDIHQIDELCWIHGAWPVSAPVRLPHRPLAANPRGDSVASASRFLSFHSRRFSLASVAK